MIAQSTATSPTIESSAPRGSSRALWASFDSGST